MGRNQMDYQFSSKLILEKETDIYFKDSIESIAESFGENDFFIIDAAVYEKYQFDLKKYYLFNGESDKEFDCFLKIIERLYKMNFGRNDRIWGIGGGATTDMAGFVAALFKRGTELTFVPTTLLAMVDSSYGGKNGVNFHAKNIVGTFYAPSKIYICKQFLDDDKTLVENGMSEIIKVAFLKKASFIDRLKRGENPDLEMIADAIKAKAFFCEKDFDERRGFRLFLNWGHTIGHALERHLNISHGQAVAEGMLIEQKLAEISGRNSCSSDDVEMVLKRYGFKSSINIVEVFRNLIDFIKVDKKNLGDKIKIVYLNGEGNPDVLEFNVFEITSYMEKLV